MWHATVSKVFFSESLSRTIIQFPQFPGFFLEIEMLKFQRNILKATKKRDQILDKDSEHIEF